VSSADLDGVPSLFDITPRWCLDTNVVVSFMREDDEEPYSRELLPAQWQAFESDISSGLIAAPIQVRDELSTWSPQIPDLARWLKTHRGMFRELDEGTLRNVKEVVNRYPTYARDRNYLGDLCVIALAGAHQLTIVSNEKGSKGQASRTRPKIPDVCAELGIDCVSVMGFLRRRG
jgi:hypothetical protein